MKKQVLRTNERQIELELSRLQAKVSAYQPVLQTMIKHGYEPDTQTFREIIIGSRSMMDVLKEMTIKKTPQIDGLPITRAAKFDMIQLPDTASEILLLFASVSKQNFVPTFKEVMKMEIKGGAWLISEAAEQEIIDSHTLYAKSKKQYEAFLKIVKVFQEMKAVSKETGFNFFAHGAVQNVANGLQNVDSWTLNAYLIHQLEQP